MESIGKLAGGIAHDFNNMLVGIMGYANIMKTKLKSAPEASYAEKILNTAQKAADLTSKLLSFSRKGKLFFKSVDLHLAIKESVALLERSIDKRITINLSLLSVDHYVQGDLAQLQNAILNIGVNARDAMPDGGTITINTTDIFLDEQYCRLTAMDLVPGNYIKLSIKDSGQGIPTEDLKHIFEPFFTTKQSGKGTGLGLSVVYGTIKEHKGTVTVYSEPENGTEFHIYIPTSQPITTDAKSVDTSIKRGSGTILVVDDEEIVRSLACDLLEELGYRVIIAADGEQGINTFRSYQHKIDLVILDIIMPKVNGIDCFKGIREIKNDARIILNSGFIQDSKITDLLKEPHVSFIKKPYTSIQLSTAIQQALTAD